MNAKHERGCGPSRWLRLAMAAGLALTLLGGCDGGGRKSGGSTGTGGATGTPSVHMAGLGPLSGSRVRVELLNAPGLTIAQTVTDADGRFSLPMPSGGPLDDTWALVIVDEGADTDADADGVPDATPTPFNGVLRALVKARWLAERSIAVSALSDALYLSVAGALNDVPAEAIERVLNKSAYAMLKADFDGDHALSYDDILAFNASRPGDQAKLDFDYRQTLLTAQGSDGTSLASKYHRGDDLLGPAVDEAFGRTIKPSLPAPEQLSTVAITLKAGLGGSVTGPALDGTVIGGSFGTFVHRMERSADPLVITASPDPDFVFSRWAGCPELIPGEPQSCRIPPTDTHVVTAQFAVAQRRLAAGFVGEVVLDAESGRLGVSFPSPTEMLLTTRADDHEMRAIIDGLSADMIVYTGIFARPQLHVKERLVRDHVHRHDSDGQGHDEGRGNDDGHDGGHDGRHRDLYRGRYRVADIALADAYDAITLQMLEDPLTLDDLTAITVADPASGTARNASGVRTVQLPHPLMRGYIPGPGPDQGSAVCPGYGREAAYRFAADGSGRTETICIEPGSKPAASGASCAITERTVDLVDGRRYCLLDGSWNSAHNRHQYRHARELAADLQRNASGAGLVKVASKTATAKPAPKTAPIQQPSFGREVFLAGYGRAYDLGHGQYLTNNPDARGLSLIEIEGPAVPITDPKLLVRTVSATCRLNRFATGCPRRRGAGLIKTQTIDPFPPLPGFDGIQIFSLQDIELTFPKAEALTVTVKLQVNVDARNSGSGSYAAPLAGEVRMSGYVAVTPSLGVKLTLGAGKDFLERTGKPKPGTKEKVEAKKLVFSIDFAKHIPKVGAVMQGDIDFTLGVDLTGSIELDNKLQVPVVTRYDVDAAAGLRCPSTIDLGLFEIPNPGSCTTTSRFDVVVRPSVMYRYRMQGTANVLLEPYAEVALTAGIKGGFERMAKLAARGFVQAEAILQSPVIQATNIPQIIAAQGGKRTCVDGPGEARINLWYGYRLYGQLTTADTLIGKIVTLTKVFPFVEQKWPIAGWGWELTTGEKLDPPKAVSQGLFLNPVTDEPEPCSGGTRPKEVARSFRAGTLEMQDGSFVATTTRKLVMQADGNLVMYDYDAENAKENEPLLASGTSGTFNQRVLFQTDGNLVIYDLKDQARWSSGTFGNPNAVLKLTEAGDVLIVKSATSYPIWGRVLDLQAGQFFLQTGESVQNETRRLVFQPDGNLVLYKMDKGNQLEALWASGSSGNSTGGQARAVFTSSGRIEVYRADGYQTWTTVNPTISSGAVLRLQRDGNLVIYAPGDNAVWATGTNGR